MAKVFRAMFAAADGRPSVANDKNSMGVTTPAERPVTAPPDWTADVLPDADGRVDAGRGLSVAPATSDLPAWRLPQRLRGRGVPKARGSDKLFVWSHGRGPFESAEVSPGLRLQPDSATHGLIEPAERMPLGAYRQCLAETATDWKVDEP